MQRLKTKPKKKAASNQYTPTLAEIERFKTHFIQCREANQGQEVSIVDGQAVYRTVRIVSTVKKIVADL